MHLSFKTGRSARVGMFLVLLAAPVAGAQRTVAARDSVLLAQQARQIARLDSQLTLLRREVRARRADSARADQDRDVPSLLSGVRAGGLIQVWYAQGDNGFQNTFRVRRTELRLSGDVSSQARWGIMIDPARALTTSSTTTDVNGTSLVTGTTVNQSSRILMDAFMALTLPAQLELDVGQFKLPLGLEGGVQSSAALETVERALFTSDHARGGIYGDARDIGVMVRDPANGDVDFAIGVFNGVGESQNDTDRNGAKAVVGRLVTRVPFLPQLSVGGSGALGTQTTPDSVLRRRGGVEAKLVAGPLMLKSEYMSGRDGQRRGAGWYGHVGYSLTPNLTVIARRDVFDPDLDRETTLADALERDWIGGFTYDLARYDARLQMNYLAKSFAPGIASSRGLLLTNLQVSW
jgi:Phosphate-selective porin